MKKQYKNFGALLCCSSNGVLKVEKVKQYIDILSKMGYNLLELCIDDMYKIDSEPYFGYLRGGYTKQELKEMDAYAQSKGIQLVPVIQTLAHLTNLLKIPHYADVVDMDDVLLIDEEKTYQLIDKMFATISECFTTRLVNIGFDEAFKVGLGNYLTKHGYTDRYELLLKHLKRVVKIAESYNFNVCMYSDMFFRVINHGKYTCSESIRIPKSVRNNIPQSVSLCYWDYYSTQESNYDTMFTTHEQFEREIWFAGGAWTWSGFAPHNDFALNSMRSAMKQVRKHNIQNVIITCWGDNGHDCSYFSALPTLYAIKQYAEGNFDEQSIKQGFYQTFHLDFDNFMLLQLPNINAKNPHGEVANNFCKAMLYNDCLLGIRDKWVEQVGVVDFVGYADKLNDMASQMGEYAYLFESMAALCEVMSIKYDLGYRTRKAYLKKDVAQLKSIIADYEKLLLLLKRFRKKFKAVWFEENKPFGWEVQQNRLGALICRVEDCKERLEDYVIGAVEKIPELEEEILEYAQWYSQFNSYRQFITVSEI